MAARRLKPSRERSQEAEANLFAINLLLDADMVRDAAAHYAPDGFDIENDPVIAVMAKKFMVSTQLMIIRLCQLGYFEL